jgi:hypothetical protein
MLQAIWNWYSPLNVLKDASRGTLAERAAALRYNREMRGCLTTYISRWLWSFTAALLLVCFFDAMTPYEGDATLNVFVLIAATFALFAATAVCAICLLSYAYASLAFAAARSPDPGPRP